MRIYKITFDKYKPETFVFDEKIIIQIKAKDTDEALTDFLNSKKRQNEIVVVKSIKAVPE